MIELASVHGVIGYGKSDAPAVYFRDGGTEARIGAPE
jgi:hypothetical protein